MSDEETLRQLARQAITAKRVPAARPKDTWGGNGTGALCDVCGLPIPQHELGFEVEFPGATAPARTYYLHNQCFAAWELERHVPEAEQPHKRDNGRVPFPPFPQAGRPSPASNSHPPSATASHRLSETDKAGSMPDCERNAKNRGKSS